MHTNLQAGGRSIEEFVGSSTKGDLNEALVNAIRSAQLTLGTPEIRWTLLHLSGKIEPAANSLVVTIKAKRSSD